MLLEGKAAVVTGSSRGLGRAFAMGLAKEGASVVVNGTVAEDVAKVVEEIKGAGGKAVGCVESVATIVGAQHIIQTALYSFGRIDILVNNAGILRDHPFLETSEGEWDAVINVHLKGHFACSKWAARHMSEQQSGRIINLTSGAAWGAGAIHTNYVAAKAGVLGFTYALALELARYNITVNAVRPQALTRMTTGLLERRLQRAREAAKRTNAPEPTLIDVGLGDPELVAPIVVFLASDEAKDITGKIFSLGGEKLSVFSRNVEVASATMRGGWTVDELRKRFKVAFGKALR
ncbi:MAG: SDR family NAD(P)-dependent oxidoreductase [Chloroflexi bacterium]|nr:SDR family NAD(P)-dependent oxidoreductase [Chloroflexota bacterium]